jgi:hypothetical protein
VLAHKSIKSNEIAYKCGRLFIRKKARLAKEGGLLLKLRVLQVRRDWIKKERIRYFDKLQVGKFTRKIDKALLKEHITQIYNALTREEAGILLRLRTNHTPLNNNLARIRAEESAACTCGAT